MSATPNPHHEHLTRALPSWAVDAIRDGVPGNDHRRVWNKLMSIAMSAAARGWTESDYTNAVASTESKLWTQLMTRRDGRKGSLPVAYRSVRKAWAVGYANVQNVGVRTAEEIARDVTENAYLWAERLDAGTDELTETETAVMRFVIAEHERRGYTAVALPRRGVAEAVGISEERARGALVRLERRGVLVKVSAGRPGPEGVRKAATFSLPDLDAELRTAEERGRGKTPHKTRGSIPMGGSVPSAVVDASETGTEIVAATVPSAVQTDHGTEIVVQLVPSAVQTDTGQASETRSA